MSDKRMTEDEAVATLADGMTLGIGGWGSRRKPMSLVRALLRSPVRDLTVVSYGGPDVGLLCAAGKVRSLVDGVIEAPHGAHFTSCEPDYGRDESFQRDYAGAARDGGAWTAFVDRYLSGDEAHYQAAVGARG